MAKKKEKWVVLEVTIKRRYAFREGEINGWPVETVIEDWFHRCPLYASHVTRDSYAVGYSDQFVSAERIK